MAATPVPPVTMVGRAAESAVLRDLVAGTRDAGSALVLEGDPGVGKTALLDYAADEARRAGFRVLRCAGSPHVATVGFDALQELLQPLLPLADALPVRQRTALLVAFGLADGPVPDPLLISLACLGLLEEAASCGPVFSAVEDGQWLDPSSRSVLSFVARRLSQSPILLVAATRDRATDDALPLPRLTVAPLDEPAATALLDDIAADLPTLTRSRIRREAGGNPLALRELATAVRAHGADLDVRLPTTARLERAFLDQLATVPARSRTLLIVAAASDSADLQDVLTAAGVGIADLEPLEAAGLVTAVGSRLRFRHPLVRSTVEGAATTPEWTAAHAALASVITDPVRAAWHRASATLGWDAAVADELDAAAHRAQQRGALPEAVRAYRRAAVLSPDPKPRARRLAKAAEAARGAGMSQDAVALLEQVDPATLEPETLADVGVTRFVLGLRLGVPGPSQSELAAMSEALSRRPEDVHRRVKILWSAALDVRARSLPQPEWRRVEAELESIPADDPLKVIALALLAPRGRAAELHPLVTTLADDPQALISLGVAAESLQDLDTALASWSRSYERLHELGATADQSEALRGRAGVLLLRGRLRDALADAEYAVRIAQDTGQPLMEATARATAARAHALLGNAADAREALGLFQGRLRPLAIASTDAHWAAGLLALADHRYGDALDEFTRMTVHTTRSLWAIADRTEAAVHAGRPESVLDDVREAEDVARTFGATYLTAIVARSTALLSGDDAGFRRAVDTAAVSGSPLDLGRAHLLHGEWLRRHRRVVDARAELSEALRQFDAVGARSFAERAAAELRATGETSPRPLPVERKPLTPQELQVAQLAAQGLSNKEIADRIYLSHRTVSTHLYRAFPKLGVAGRSQLAEALHALSPGAQSRD